MCVIYLLTRTPHDRVQVRKINWSAMRREFGHSRKYIKKILIQKEQFHIIDDNANTFLKKY